MTTMTHEKTSKAKRVIKKAVKKAAPASAKHTTAFRVGQLSLLIASAGLIWTQRARIKKLFESMPEMFSSIASKGSAANDEIPYGKLYQNLDTTKSKSQMSEAV